MTSRAFKNYIKFIMSKLKVDNYKIKYKIAIDYDISKSKLDIIENLSTSKDGLIPTTIFYGVINSYNFMDNKRVIEGELHKEVYEVDGDSSLITSVPENITFELDDNIQKTLNIPIYIEYLNELKKNEGNTKVTKKLKEFCNININSKNKTEYVKKVYEKACRLINTEYLNDSEQVLQLKEYNEEYCKLADKSYKYTFGVLVYLEDENNVCPICYSKSNNPHMILDNFKIVWDSVGVVSIKGK